MIPAPPDMYIELRRATAEGGTYLAEERIYAWDGEGHSLVASDSGHLVRTADLPDAEVVGLTGNEGSIIAAVPGDGWVVTHVHNGEERSDVVVAFAMTAYGYTSDQWMGLA